LGQILLAISYYSSWSCCCYFLESSMKLGVCKKVWTGHNSSSGRIWIAGSNFTA
jgi:hypothetical protein